MEALRAELAAAGATTHLQLCADAARLLADGDTGAAEDASLRFDHVVVDEAQDLHPAEWRVLWAAVPAGPDDTFLTGDPHQRINDAKVSLAALGIRTAGRSFRLRINYRSTAEILTWSTGLLDGDGRDNLTGYRSLLRGRRPTVAGFPDEPAEAAALVQRAREWLDRGVRPAEVAGCTRFKARLDPVQAALAEAGMHPRPRSAACVVDGPTESIPPAIACVRGSRGRLGQGRLLRQPPRQTANSPPFRTSSLIAIRLAATYGMWCARCQSVGK
ncbi:MULTISPECIES: UvrD-helicase domain-containing protein [unclassified Solwaraspora]|uniref:UvrD-helicase domain-containing protein n=1 Tax=unclassified Solwaraspora TaxID=2627926 RepID=UPI00248BD0EC|nr:MULTISPECIES: UvrD-helicase domain-containing protein [unclassified Solwaraspora]WBB98255.1 UvrD-helicase domain-containing protein [Solwaraspora sp. WMMA2059]WBC23191.1 UvrD-helicase domain-containing protein [Solwaraspora sp. WMMA2080]WJK34735.1 UvrD-helicase domain-containing protein [Solwaraspora sp. WMMA2065]